jgi:hypothetical protein
MMPELTSDMTAAEKSRAILENQYENTVCGIVGRELEKHYPGWEWYVECKLPTGLVSVRNLSLHGEYGFYLSIAAILNETDPKLVMLAGGEILERYWQGRGKRPAHVDKVVDIRGNAMGDTADAAR